MATTSEHSTEFTIARATRWYHSPPARSRRSPATIESSAGCRRSDGAIHVASPRQRQLSPLPACRPTWRRVSATCARVCHLSPDPDPEARWTWSTVSRVTDVWAPHVRFFFLFIFSEIPRADVMLMSCLRNIPIFLLRNNSD